MNYQDLVSVFYNRYSIVDNESVHHKIKERVMQRVIFCKEILFSPEAIAKFTLHETAHKCQMRSFDALRPIKYFHSLAIGLNASPD